jgi:hypothetical protein
VLLGIFLGYIACRVSWILCFPMWISFVTGNTCKADSRNTTIISWWNIGIVCNYLICDWFIDSLRVGYCWVAFLILSLVINGVFLMETLLPKNEFRIEREDQLYYSIIGFFNLPHYFTSYDGRNFLVYSEHCELKFFVVGNTNIYHKSKFHFDNIEELLWSSSDDLSREFVWSKAKNHPKYQCLFNASSSLNPPI